MDLYRKTKGGMGEQRARRACGRRGVCLEGDVYVGVGGGGAGGGERMEKMGGAGPGLTNGLQMLPPHTTPEHLSVWTT